MGLKSRSTLLAVLICIALVPLGVLIWNKVARREPSPGASLTSKTVPSDPGPASDKLDENSGSVKAALPLFHRMNANYIRGAEPGTGGVEILSRLGVKSVVDLRSEYDRTERVGKECERLGLHYYRCPLSVWDPPTDAETDSFLAIVSDQSNAPVFVFCADGLNRTGEMTAIYRVQHDHLTPEQAVKEMDDLGFSPYYYSLRSYVWDYTREHKPGAIITKAH